MYRSILMEKQIGSVQRKISVDLICSDLVEPLHSVLTAGIHHNLCAQYVCFKEDSRILYGSVYMAFSSKVDNNVRMFFLED